MFVFEKGQAAKLDGNENINYYQGVSIGAGDAEISGGKVVGISQDTERANKNLDVSKTSKMPSQITRRT